MPAKASWGLLRQDNEHPTLLQHRCMRYTQVLPPPSVEEGMKAQVEATCPRSHSEEVAVRTQTRVWLSARCSFSLGAQKNKHLQGSPAPQRLCVPVLLPHLSLYCLQPETRLGGTFNGSLLLTR